MRRIKFDAEMVASIRSYAVEHSLLETCNRFTLTPTVLKRVSKQYGIEFVHKSTDSSAFIPTTRYSMSDVVKKYKGYSNIHEDSKGNIVCDKPNWYTGRPNSRVVYLHNLLMCHAIGISSIPKNFMVIHIDGDARNLSIDNLALCTISGSSNFNSLQGAEIRDNS